MTPAEAVFEARGLSKRYRVGELEVRVQKIDALLA
jgi:hypothetical protein